MTLLKDNNYKEINVALLSIEADIKNKITNFDTSVIDKQLAEINSRIDKINAGGNNTSASINDIRYEIEDINSKLNGNSVKIKSIEQKLSDIFSADKKVTDFNTTTDPGIYYWIVDAANRPANYGVLLVNDGGSDRLWINQIAYGTNNKIYFRQNINSTGWTEWKAVAFEGEGKANFLDEYVVAGGTRLTSGNIVPKDTSEWGGMRKDVVTTSMTDGSRPGIDGHLLTMFWDNAGRYDSQLFLTCEEPPVLKVRVKENTADYGPWVDVITSNNIGSQIVAKAGTADKATSDANGNNIVNTYATKTELENTTTKGVSLSTVTTRTTKYIKLGTFHWYDSFSFKCRIAGNSFEDDININILGGIANASSVCGYYSTNSRLTKSIIVKRGEAWSSNFEIYLKIEQLTTAEVYVTIDKNIQDRINISESTTAPSGTLEEIAFNNFNGMFSSSVEAKNLTLVNGTIVDLNTFGNEPLSIGTPSGINLGIDRNSIQARNNGAADVLYLNYYGGSVQIGRAGVTGSKLTIQGNAVGSNSYTDANPKLEFKNDDGSQNISLTFTDADAVQAPASLTLNGNQGNEYFIAPCIKANNKMRIPIGAPSSLEDGCIWIER